LVVCPHNRVVEPIPWQAGIIDRVPFQNRHTVTAGISVP
jgi:hypothetical protein